MGTVHPPRAAPSFWNRSTLLFVFMACILLVCSGCGNRKTAKASALSAGELSPMLEPTFTPTSTPDPFALVPTPTLLPQWIASAPTLDETEGLESRDADTERANIPVVVIASALNVRSGPDETQAVIDMLDYGTCISVDGQRNGWGHFYLPDGREGWSHGAYLQAVGACPNGATAETGATSSGVTSAEEVIPVHLVTNPLATAPVQTAAPVQAAASQPAVVESVTAQSVAAQSTAVEDFVPDYMASPYAPNSYVYADTYIHECFGGEGNELRWVEAGTPIQLVGTGRFITPVEQIDELPGGSFVKIRIWDGQVAWIPAAALRIDSTVLPKVSGRCEEYDRISF